MAHQYFAEQLKHLEKESPKKIVYGHAQRKDKEKDAAGAPGAEDPKQREIKELRATLTKLITRL